jgi:transcriptional regulator with XRE-family HTH domain
LARRTGISKPQLDKLMQRRVVATNVDDATKLARFFGDTVEDFMRITEPGSEPGNSLARIRLLAGQLSPAEQDMLEAQIAGLLARKGPAR